MYLPGIWEPLTPWSGISNNLTVAELLTKYPIFYGILGLLPYNLSLSWTYGTNAANALPPFLFHCYHSISLLRLFCHQNFGNKVFIYLFFSVAFILYDSPNSSVFVFIAYCSENKYHSEEQA
jgi:hypothetical protein